MSSPGHQVTGLVISICLLCIAAASPPASTAERQPQDSTQGSLWLRDAQDNPYQPAPTLDTSVDIMT